MFYWRKYGKCMQAENKRTKREKQILFKGVVVVFFCTESIQYAIWNIAFSSKLLPYSETNVWHLSFCSDSPNHSSSGFSGVSMMGTISGISSPCLICQERCHEIHLASRSDLKRQRRTMTWLPAVSHSLDTSTLQKISACLRWNRCQICLKDTDQRVLPAHTAHIKTAHSWIALFPTGIGLLLMWVSHKIHILISLKGILIIYTDFTISSVEENKCYTR